MTQLSFETISAINTLKKRGMSVEDIAKATGLSAAKIKPYIKEAKRKGRGK